MGHCRPAQHSNRTKVTNYELKNISPEDIEDLLVKVERSFDLNFDDSELIHIRTLGELCDHITHKIQLENTDDCTSQQAFYKLRNAIAFTQKIDRKTIATTNSLDVIFPKKNRRTQIRKLEEYLDFKINILRPPHWVTWTLLFLFLVSCLVLFLNWKIGISGLIVCLVGARLSDTLGNEINVQTVGQLAHKITRENYLKSRRNPKTYNKNEIEKVLIDWFSNDLDLDKSKLTRETKFS